MLQASRLSTRAIVLRLVPYRESDRVVHLFTEELGKIAAIARGARKSNQRFGGALQAFVIFNAELKVRPQAEMAELVSATPLLSFASLALHPHRLGRAGYMCELLDVLTRERDPAPTMLALLEEALSLCARTDVDGGALLRMYEVAVLDALGWWPDSNRCQHCGVPLGPEDAVSLSDGVEGFVHSQCLSTPPVNQALRTLLTPGPLARLGTLHLRHDDLLLAGRKTYAKIQALSPRKLKTFEFLRQLGRQNDRDEDAMDPK